MIRVLIADDSLLTRMVLRDLLSRDPEIQVIAEVGNGQQAHEETRRLRPDLIIMDVQMPVMDGLAAVVEIMADCPTPILVLSASVTPGDSLCAFNAIRHGALDVMPKPQGNGESLEVIAGQLIEKVKTLARVRVMHHFRRRQTSPAPARIGGEIGRRDILAIGASTGGPPAILRVLKEFPGDIDARILIVQHIAAGFAAGFADWLNQETALKVRLARTGDILEPGVALVAPNGSHLLVKGERVLLSEEPPVNSCRPAVDVLFTSLAESLAERTAAILLTGMGRDGAEGMVALRRSGAYTIAQDASSCAIFGMPKVAIESGSAMQVLPLNDIPPVLLQMLRR